MSTLLEHSKFRLATYAPLLEPASYTRPRLTSTLTGVEPEDLARFEGEGGLAESDPAAAHHRQELCANEDKDL